MPTVYNKSSDHYVDAHTRDSIRRLLKAEGLSHTDIAYQMRMTRSHISGMLGGSKKMARHHLLALQFILLKTRSNKAKKEREELAAPTEL